LGFGVWGMGDWAQSPIPNKDLSYKLKIDIRIS